MTKKADITKKKSSPYSLSSSSGSISKGKTGVRIPKTAEIIASRIRKSIIRGELQPGDFLKPEALLMEEFSTSRPTIREAFRILESEQFISVKRGARSGAEIHLPSSDMVARYAGYVLMSQGTTLVDVYTARLSVEPLAVRLLTQECDPEKIEALEQAIEQVEFEHKENELSDYRLAAMHFHLRLVELSGSNTLTLIFSMLEQVFESHQLRYDLPPFSPDLSDEERESRYVRFIKSIRKLVKLISKGNPTTAAGFWRGHLESVNEIWLTGFDETALVDILD